MRLPTGQLNALANSGWLTSGAHARTCPGLCTSVLTCVASAASVDTAHHVCEYDQ